MHKMTILFGFDSSQFSTFITAVAQYLGKNGIDVNPVCKLSKQAIKEYIQTNPSVYTVILTETLKKGKFMAEELAELTDDRDMNIIVVLSSSHKGTDYMQTLYAAGITSAIFQDGKKGLSASDTCKYIYRKRSRREAREYYGISDRKMELGFLSNGTFAEHYAALSDEQYGESLIERFLMVCQRMTAKQIKDFVRRLDDTTKNELVQYEEFFVLNDMLKQFKVDLGIKRPRRKLKVGLANATQLIGLKSTLQSKPQGVTEPVRGLPLDQHSSVTTVDLDFEQIPEETQNIAGDEFLGTVFDAVDDTDNQNEQATVASSTDVVDEVVSAPAEASYVPELESIDLSFLSMPEPAAEAETGEDASDLGEPVVQSDAETETGAEEAAEQSDTVLSAKERKAALKRLRKEEKERKKLEKQEKRNEKNAQKMQNSSKKQEKVVQPSKKDTPNKPIDKTLFAMGLFAGFVFLCLIFAVLVLIGVIPMM